MIIKKPAMFREAEASRAPSNIVLQILIFLAVFLVIYIAEGIFASVFAVPAMLEAMAEAGVFDPGQTYGFSKAFDAAMSVASDHRVMIPSLFATVFGTIISIIYCRFIEKRSLGSMGMRKKNAFRNYLAGMALGFGLIALIVLVCLACGAIRLEAEKISIGLIILYFFGFIVQGMSEEFIFRGYLMNTVGGKHSAAAALAVSSVAFSLAHIANPGIGLLALFNIALFGLFAGLYMICFDDIWGACAIHSIWNFTQGHIFGISVSGTGSSEGSGTTLLRTITESDNTLITGGSFGIEASIITTAVLLAGCAVVFIKIKKNQAAEADNTQA